MRVEDLKSRICPDLLVDVESWDDRLIGITSFNYPDGDSVNLYFRDLDDELEVSDEGTTLRVLRQLHVEQTTERKEIIKRMCKPYGVEFQQPRLVKRFNPDQIGGACVEFCEAVTRVSSIYYHSAGALRSPLPVAVDELLRSKVEAVRHIERKWTHRRHDPKGSFPVDFHVNGVGKARNIFAVTTRGKGILVAAVVHFLRSHGVNSPTMTIVDPDAALGPRDINRLQLASTEIRFGIDKYQKDVIDFALATAN